MAFEGPWPAIFDLPPVEDTGFLDRDEVDIQFSATLYIAAMARSGSTGLANMLTMPPLRWLINEPWFITGVTSGRLFRQAIDFGGPSTWQEWALPSGATRKAIKARYLGMLVPLLSRLEKWGAKEVRPQFHAPTIATIQPSKIIVLTRNVEDVYVSLLEKGYKVEPGRYSERWTREYCVTAAAYLFRMAEDPAYQGRLRILRFEDFYQSKDARTELSDWLDWPLVGDPTVGLAAAGRGYEIPRANLPWFNPLSLSARGLPSFVEKAAKRIGEECADYQRRFGYATRY